MLQRSWHVEGQSVRPDHRMVAHTGFLTAARLLGRRRRRRTGPPATLDLLDPIIVVVAVTAAIGGYRLGFVARVASWLGPGRSGLYVAIRLLPHRELVSAADLTGQLLGRGAASWWAGPSSARRSASWSGAGCTGLLPLGPLRDGGRRVGAGVGIVGVLVALWLLLPSMAAVAGVAGPGQARDSAIAQWVTGTSHAARHPAGAAPPGRAGRLPRCSTPSHPARTSGRRRPPSGLDAALRPGVAASTVKVEGQACSRI